MSEKTTPAKKGTTPAKKTTTVKKTAAVKKAAPAKKAVAEKKPVAGKKSAAAASKKSTTSVKKVADSKKVASKTTADGVGTFTPYVEKKGDEYMSDTMKEHFRAILHAWKNDLMEEVDRTVHHMQDEAANFPDPNDRATQESEFTMELRTRDRERKLIKKIDEALDMLNKDEYGYCESCGVEIGIRRLEARPTATLCIDCKTLDEIREKQMG